MILADTPWTFPFWFAWMLLSVLAPVVLLAAAVLAVLRVTRRIGFAMLIGGAIGSLCGALGDLVLMIVVHEHVSQTAVVEWIFAAAGGFSLISVSAGALTAARLQRHDLANRCS